MLNRRQWLHQLGLALSAFAQPKNALAVPSSNEQPKPQANNKKPALALADYEPGSMLHAQETFVEARRLPWSMCIPTLLCRQNRKTE